MSLNARQIKFAQEFVLCGNAARAARAAGYSPHSAKATASRLMQTNDDLMAAIDEFRRGLETEFQVSKDRVVREIQAAIEMAQAQGDASAVISGWREIGRMCGYYDTGREDKVSVNLTAKRVIEKMETMTDVELLEITSPVIFCQKDTLGEN